MSETVNQEVNATNNQEPKEKLFTQEEVNGFFNKRYSELMSDVDTYKDKAEKYDQMVETNKTELQKATERAEQLESELNKLKSEAALKDIRAKVAKEIGVPAELLTADTEEACKEQANAILSFAKPKDYPNVKDGGEVNNVGKPSTRQQFAQWAQEAFN